VNTTYELLSAVLADRKIDDEDVALIRQRVDEDGRVTLDDVKLLVELYCAAEQRTPAFEDLFFEVLEKVLLADGEVQPSEQFYLLKMLYSDRKVTQREKQFLESLRRQVRRSSPEFETLCREALAAPETGWDLGGR
jgi:hypothetical protein